MCLGKDAYPTSKWDGSALDGFRVEEQNGAFNFICALLDITGDLKEFTERYGFPTWKAMLACFMCGCTRAEFFDPAHVVAMRPHDDYHRECSKCEILFVVATKQMQDSIRFSLIDNAALKGLCLREDLADTPLRKGDRLEPSPKLNDVHKFSAMVVPFVVTFWRIPSRGFVSAHHRNPLLSEELGTSYRTFGLDVLHTMHLGVFLSWMTRAVHYLIDVDVFASRQTRKEDHLRCCAIELYTRLANWYPEYEKRVSASTRKGVTRINHFTEHMLGTADGVSLLSLKAAEARHFLPFVLDLVRHHSEQLASVCDAEALISGGQRLLDWTEVCITQPRKMSPSAVSSLVSLIYLHNIEAERAGVRMKPKHHASICFVLLPPLFNTQYFPMHFLLLHFSSHYFTTLVTTPRLYEKMGA